MCDFKSCAPERFKVLVVGEQAQLVPLGEVLDARRSADQIVEIDHREPPAPLAMIEARDLQLGTIDEQCMNDPRSPDLRSEPRLDD